MDKFSNTQEGYVSIAEKEHLIDFLKTEKNLDFSEYSEASVRRRIAKILSERKLDTVQQYIPILRERPAEMDFFLEQFTVNVTEMFRDPFFFETLSRKLFPLWAKMERVNIYSAGCSTGEEVLSLNILLKEAGLLHKCHILATDLSQAALNVALRRTYQMRHVRKYEQLYREAGGQGKLSDYYEKADEENVIFDASLYENVSFQISNLTADRPPFKFNLILCRNVLIYFEPVLQHKVLDQFFNSLNLGSHLGLGSKESAIFYQDRHRLEEVEKNSRLYQRI